MNAQVRSQSVRWLQVVTCSLLMLIAYQARPLRAQTPEPMQLLDWVEVKDAEGVAQQLHKKLNKLMEFFIRVTSPDVPLESRRLWRVAVDGSQNCRLSD